MPNINQIVNHINISVDLLNFKKIGKHIAMSDLNIEKNSNFLIQARSILSYERKKIMFLNKKENNVSK